MFAVISTCHPERSAAGTQSKDLRTIDSSLQRFGAKILRLRFAPLRMTAAVVYCSCHMHFDTRKIRLSVDYFVFCDMIIVYDYAPMGA